MSNLRSPNADSKFIWMNGELTPYENATVHVLSHSLHYGTGAFEGIRAYQASDGRTAIFRLQDHLQRFIDSVQALGIRCPYDLSSLTQACVETVRANGFKECYIRPLAYLDDSIRGLKLPDAPVARVAIATWAWGKYMGDEGQLKGVRIQTSTYRRPDSASSLPFAKITGNYVTSVLARREATKNGMDEALLLDPQGFVAEGSGENIFVIKDKVITTPLKTAILPGITRDCAILLAKDLGYQVVEAPLVRNHLYLADEVFFTGTAVEINPVREIDFRPIGSGKPGPITLAIKERFFKAVRGEKAEYAEWLTWV